MKPYPVHAERIAGVLQLQPQELQEEVEAGDREVPA
jgi:hypothetical protein